MQSPLQLSWTVRAVKMVGAFAVVSTLKEDRPPAGRGRRLSAPPTSVGAATVASASSTRPVSLRLLGSVIIIVVLDVRAISFIALLGKDPFALSCADAVFQGRMHVIFGVEGNHHVTATAASVATLWPLDATAFK